MKKTVLVTGGAQGIGKAIVQTLLSEDWNVLAVDLDREAGEELAAELDFDAPRFLFYHGDTADEGCAEEAVQTAYGHFGGLHGLVNNAGIVAKRTSITETSREAWERVLAVNLTGPFLFAKHAARGLAEHRGAIVNIASTRALQSEPDTFAYSASKGGVVALTHALAVSLGPPVRVNCISPGWIETGPWQKQIDKRDANHTELDRLQHPVGRVGTPEDVAKLTAYLLSPDAGFITGQNFVVDGGMTRKMIYEE